MTYGICIYSAYSDANVTIPCPVQTCAKVNLHLPCLYLSLLLTSQSHDSPCIRFYPFISTGAQEVHMTENKAKQALKLAKTTKNKCNLPQTFFFC